MIRSHYFAGKVAIHKRKKLPHWDAEHGIQFVTLHLGRGRTFDRAAAVAVADVVVRGDTKRYELLAWSVMPDHLHVVLRPQIALALIVRAWKTITARRLGGGRWWQPDYFDHLVRDGEELRRTIDYVINNPDTAALTNWDFRRLYAERLMDRL